MIKDLILKNRTIRRYDVTKRPSKEDLELIISASLPIASAANRQRIRYAVITDRADDMFSIIKMGGYLPEDKKPTYDVRPTAYVVLLSSDTDSNLLIDMGIAAQTITLVSCEMGIGCCMIRSFDKKALLELIGDNGYYPELVIAMGYPVEEARIAEARDENDIKYYKNEEGINVVPKLSPKDSIIVCL